MHDKGAPGTWEPPWDLNSFDTKQQYYIGILVQTVKALEKVPVEWEVVLRNEARFSLLVAQMQTLDPGGIQPISKLHYRC